MQCVRNAVVVCVRAKMECPKCGEFASVIIDEDDIHISKKPIFTNTPDGVLKQKQHA